MSRTSGYPSLALKPQAAPRGSISAWPSAPPGGCQGLFLCFFLGMEQTMTRWLSPIMARRRRTRMRREKLNKKQSELLSSFVVHPGRLSPTSSEIARDLCQSLLINRPAFFAGTSSLCVSSSPLSSSFPLSAENDILQERDRERAGDDSKAHVAS